MGRRVELAAVRDLLDTERGFGALILEGEPGIGKTTLWLAGVRHAAESGATVLSARPTARETRLPYSALGDLVRAADSSVVEAVPEPLRSPVRAAALLDQSDVLPDARLVSRGTADLLRLIAQQGKLVVAVDDVQWLDDRSRGVLAYALRRLSDTNARVLLARRPPAGASTEVEDSLSQPDLDLVSVGPLSLSALHEILGERIGTSFQRPLLVRILRASGGNPYYALEIAREVARTGAGSEASLRLPRDVTRLTANRILRLPAETRAALLHLALASHGQVRDPDGALRAAVDDGIVEIEFDGEARFTHPLVAAAVIDVATPAERREAHLALAEL